MTEETRDEYERLLDGTDPIEKLNELALQINDHYFDVGCILFHLKENDVYKTIEGNKYYSDKHTKWKQFCEDHLSVSYRTAQYWLNMYRYFSEMGITKEKLSNLGWSKSKELIDVTEDPAILDRIIEAAENMTIGELQAYIKDFQVNEGEPEIVKFKRFTFNLPAAQSEHAEEILKLAQQQCNGDLNEAFWKVMLEWYQTYNPLPENAENIYLVTADSVDDEGQELPKSILEIIG